LTCYEYQVSGAAAGGTQDVWFDTGSYKLREWREADSAGNTTDMTVTYQPVTISAPSPVENFSAAAG
jgi:outer membrane lipoprotein-sorting protein